MSANAHPVLTPEQYLEAERAAEARSEYYRGRVYAMAGGSFQHFQIIGNLNGEIHALLKKRPCSVGPTDLRIRVTHEGLYTYPDIVVICGEPKFADGRNDTLLNPTLMIEVLSPSTEAYDRGFKFAQYRMIESLKECVLVSQTEPHVEIYRRELSGGWLLNETTGLDSACHFTSVDCSVALADIYDKVEFPPPQPIK